MRCACLALLVIGAGVQAAESGDLYESIVDVRLGRVFLTPAERERLEATRGLVVREADVDDSPETVEEAGVSAPPAAGIIVSGSGRALIWKDGSFRRADTMAIDDVHFPAHDAGGVRIERYVTAAPLESADATTGRDATGSSGDEKPADEKPDNEIRDE